MKLEEFKNNILCPECKDKLIKNEEFYFCKKSNHKSIFKFKELYDYNHIECYIDNINFAFFYTNYNTSYYSHFREIPKIHKTLYDILKEKIIYQEKDFNMFINRAQEFINIIYNYNNNLIFK